MGKRPACSKATRGVAKSKKPSSSSSSNPKCTRFRSQYNSLAVIAKGGPSKKSQNKESLKKLAKDAAERKKILDGLQNINMLGESETHFEGTSLSNSKTNKEPQGSDATRLTTASFASVWSNCSNTSLKAFFDVWNPNLETHKDALSVIAGLSQVMSNAGTEQSDLEFTTSLFKIVANQEANVNIVTGGLIALTFVMRKLPCDLINQNFDSFYPILKELMIRYETSKKKSLLKSLIRCFAVLTNAHHLGKESIESSLRKKINIAIRRCKVQSKVRL